MSYQTIEELITVVGGDAVEALAEAGWQHPVHASAAAADGCFAYVRFGAAGQPPRLLGAHCADQAPVSPVMLVFTCPDGKLATLIVDGDAIGAITILR